MVLCGSREDFDVNFATAFRKQLSVFCVSGRSENLEASVNLMVSGAVDLSCFNFRTVKPEDAQALLENYFVSPDRDFKEINVVTLI